MAVLIPCLVKLRDEFNQVSPNRDKGAEGWIGDGNDNPSSDHIPDESTPVHRNKDADSKNEVHAIDVDSSGPWPGKGTQKERYHQLIMRIVAGEKKKWLSATDKCRLNYLIWDRKIYDKDNNFEPRDYHGSDPHTNHGHFSGRYETECENDTRPWGVYQEEDFVTTQAEFNEFMDNWWNARMGTPTNNNAPSTELAKLRKAPWNQVTDSVTGKTMYQVVHEAAAVLPLVQALSEAFAAFVEAEDLEDDVTSAKLTALQASLQDVQASIDELDDELPGDKV